MPELPEVETVCTGIRPLLQDKTIATITLNRPNLRFPFPPKFAEILTNNTVLSVKRRAKYIIITLKSGHVWLTHLGMSGKFVIIPKTQSYTADKHDHVVIKTESDDTLVYNDPRRFGYMDIRAENAPCPHTNKIGAEPLGNQFNGVALYESLKTKKSPIKTALLDQRIVAGLGNIYVCEALWQSAISPTKQANHLTKPQCETLYHAIVKILNTAIQSGGSSLRDYRQADGTLGYFQHQWQAYGQENQPCPYQTQQGKKCKGKITRITQAGRSTFYCPTHQK